jgi:hypothetical protein
MKDTNLFHSIFLSNYFAAKKYQSKDKASEIAFFLTSIYIMLTILTIYFYLETLFGFSINDNIINYILIGEVLLSYIFSIIYFSYKKKYLKIIENYLAKDKENISLNKRFIIVNIVLFFAIFLIIFIKHFIFN